MTLKPLGDSAWLAEFPGISGAAALARVMGLLDALQTGRPPGVLDVVPSFDSLAVHSTPATGLEILEWIKSVTVTDRPPAGREWQIPVCYGGDNGPNLDEVAAHNTAKSTPRSAKRSRGGNPSGGSLGASWK